MSQHWDAIDVDTAPIVRETFGDDIGTPQLLAGGFFSRAYSFTSGGRDYVVRINTAPHAAESFAKDDYAARHYASPGLPIPCVIRTGSRDGAYYAISERAPGRSLAEHARGERRTALPSLLDTLDAIGQVSTNASHGYGDWGADGNGKFASWHDYLTTVIENEDQGYYAGWHALFAESFLDRDVYAAGYARMLELFEHCPEERSLIHNDYWFENMLAHDGTITGVIDWANALYGDPLYDIARLSWGSAYPGWWYDDGSAILRDRYGHLPNYAERITCYACHIGLDDLRFYAKTGRRAEYDFFRSRLLALVEGAMLADERN